MCSFNDSDVSNSDTRITIYICNLIAHDSIKNIFLLEEILLKILLLSVSRWDLVSLPNFMFHGSFVSRRHWFGVLMMRRFHAGFTTYKEGPVLLKGAPDLWRRRHNDGALQEEIRGLTNPSDTTRDTHQLPASGPNKFRKK